jgi:hypothetical protein
MMMAKASSRVPGQDYARQVLGRDSFQKAQTTFVQAFDFPK